VDIRSAIAAIVSDGFAPTGPGMAAPSASGRGKTLPSLLRWRVTGRKTHRAMGVTWKRQGGDMTNQRHARHIAIVHLLRSRQWVSSVSLANRFRVSQRTIYRDIEELIAAGIPIEAVAAVRAATD
jgi:hypothetical protein